MAGAAFSIKLRCASWPQLATVYRRDLSRGSMFLKATSQPPIGTIVRIDLELPSATVIELQGTITEHVVDPARGTGVNLKLDPLPTKSVWIIESALAAENKVRAQTGGDGPSALASAVPSGPASRPATLSDGEEVTAAEVDLIRALEAEAESLHKLNPFLVLGVGYEATDGDVRTAFGELTKRYHPDRFVRYQSVRLRQIAAEIFILIRDAYRRLADQKGRQQVIATLGPKIPMRAQTHPRGSAPPGPPAPARVPPRVAVPPPKPPTNDIPTAQSPYDAPTNPSARPAELASTELARPDMLSIPIEKAEVVRTTSPQAVVRVTPPQGVARAKPPPGVVPDRMPPRKPSTASPLGDLVDTSALEAMLDQGKLDEALAQYCILAKKHPHDRGVLAGIELVEGLRALTARDRLEAAQRFEAALELDPSNERAARELADMRRHATNERKGLLSRLMGKKEPPP
jgi:hypothetical protein